MNNNEVAVLRDAEIGLDTIDALSHRYLIRSERVLGNIVRRTTVTNDIDRGSTKEAVSSE